MERNNLNDLKIMSESLRLEYVNYCSFMADAHRSSIFVDMDFLPDHSQEHQVGYWKEGFSFVVNYMKSQLKIEFAPPVRVYISSNAPDKSKVAIAVRDALDGILKLGIKDNFRLDGLATDDHLSITISYDTSPRAWNKLLDKREEA